MSISSLRSGVGSWRRKCSAGAVGGLMTPLLPRHSAGTPGRSSPVSRTRSSGTGSSTSIPRRPPRWQPLNGLLLWNAARSSQTSNAGLPRDHSPAVSSLARKAAANVGLDAVEVESTAAAGLVQELGKTGVPNGTLAGARPLTHGEWDTIRLSTYLTQRILGRCKGLEAVNALASSHHERLDGSGYHRGLMRDQISTAAQILAAADAFKAMTSERPWRPRLTPDEAAR